MNPENSNKPNSNNSEPSSVPPPPPPFNNVTPPPSPFQSAPPPPPFNNAAPSSPPTGAGWQRWLELIFPTHLRTAYKGATPEQLLRLYGWRIAVAILLLFFILKFAYTLLSLLLAIALICLLVGLFNPESFRPLFGEKTSKATVGWTFGAAVCLCALGASITEPKREVATSTPTPMAVVPPPAPASQSIEGQGNNAATKPRVVAATKTKPIVKPKPAPKLSVQQTIKGLMEKQFGERLRDVQVTSVGQRMYVVRVEFNNSVRWNARATRGYMEGDMQDAYKAIFTSGFKIVEASMDIYGSGTDKFGQPFSARAYHTALDGEVAEKINWDNHRAAKWDELWTVVFLYYKYRTENLDRDWAKAEAAAKKSVEPEEVEREMQRRESEERWPYN